MPLQVKQSDMAKDVVADFEAGVEYATAECLLKMKKRGQERLYLVRWAQQFQLPSPTEKNFLVQVLRDPQPVNPTMARVLGLANKWSEIPHSPTQKARCTHSLHTCPQHSEAQPFENGGKPSKLLLSN